MVRGRVDRFRHPYRKAIERYKRRTLRKLREEMVRRGWTVVTPFWPRLEAPEVLWRRGNRSRRHIRRPAGEQLRIALERVHRAIRLMLMAHVYARRAARHATALIMTLRRPRRFLGIMRRAILEFVHEFRREFTKEFAKEAREWLREGWLYRTYRYIKTRIEFIRVVRGLLKELHEGSLVPLFEAAVQTIDGAKVYRVTAVDQALRALDPETRYRVIQNIVAMIERGRPMYRDLLNPYVRLFLAMLVPQLYRDKCHHKGFAVKVAPVVLEEVDKRGLKRVYVFLRVARVEQLRADPLVGKGARITDPVLEEIAMLKPDEDETSLLNASKKRTPYTRTALHRRIIEYPEALLMIHEAGVRRALALAAGVPEQDVAEGVDACSLYLAHPSWATHDDFDLDDLLLLSKPGRRVYGVPVPGVRRIGIRDEILEELGLL